MIEIHNDGPAITRTSYWRTDHARKAGLLYLSVNAGAIRVLVPAKVERMLVDFPAVGVPVTLSADVYQGRATYVLQWDEPPHTGLEPYSIDVDQAQCDRLIPAAELGRIVPLIWYAQVGVWGVREIRREQVQLGEEVAS